MLLCMTIDYNLLVSLIYWDRSRRIVVDGYDNSILLSLSNTMIILIGNMLILWI
jgi:hypothetical protein